MKRYWQLLLSVGLSAVFVWLSLRGTRLDEVGQALLQADPLKAVLFLLVLSLMHFVRVARWGLLVRPLAPVPFRSLNELCAVGIMALTLLPLRLGELARPMLLARRYPVRRTAALAGVVVERVADGLFMGLLLVLMLHSLGNAMNGESVGYVRAGGQLVTVAFGALLVALWAAYRHRSLVEQLLRHTVGRASPSLGEKLVGVVESFTEGLAVLPSLAALGRFLLMTALFWGLNGVGVWVLARAFGLELTALQSLTVLALQVMGAMIPAGPGMVGTLQFFTRMGVGLFVTAPEQVPTIAAFAHAGWLMGFLQPVLFGLYFVVTGRVQLQEALGLPAAAPTPATTAAAGR